MAQTVVYVNRFRGFENALISLKDVNFFVGENSSGKTSLLKLIKAIFNPDFFFRLSLAMDESDLGYFDELVTSGRNYDSFEVAIFSSNTYSSIKALLMRFHSVDSQPEVTYLRIATTTGQTEIMRNENNGVKYRHLNEPPGRFLSVSKRKSWITKNPLADIEYKIKGDDPDKRLPFYIAVEMVISEVDAGSPESRADLFTFGYGLSRILWFGPTRTEPRRTYDSFKTAYKPDGTHAPYLLRKLLADPKKRKGIESSLSRFGKDSGLFNKIDIHPLGNSPSSPFELHIHINSGGRKITNVGYGVSQILPLVIECLSEHDRLFVMQQPEIHLHPKAQAAVGGLLFDSAQNFGNSFIIETHSDYTIDRFRLALSENAKKSKSRKTKLPSGQILFFESDSEGNHVSTIRIEKNGKFGQNQPENFKSFFLQEQLRMIQL